MKRLGGRGRGEGMRNQLRDELAVKQLNTFTRWWNSWLSECNLSVTDLCEDVRNGVYPIKLLEVLSDSSCGKYNKNPRSKFQSLENLNVFLAQLKAKSIKLVNIGAEDLESGDRKLVLGLTWTLILRYEIHKYARTHPTGDLQSGRWCHRGLTREVCCAGSEPTRPSSCWENNHDRIQ